MVSFVVFLMTTSGSVEFAEANVAVSALKVMPPAVAVRPIAAASVPASFTIVIVCDVPASAWSLMQSAASSLAVTTARPPSAQRSLPSA